MADTPYIVFEKTRIQRIEDPEKPEEYTEVTAYIPVAGEDSGHPAVFANSGPEACRKLASELDMPLEEFGKRSYRGAPVRNWSGTEADTELRLVFTDVLPPKVEKRDEPDEPEASAQPDPPPEPEPVAPEPQATEPVKAEDFPDAPGSEPDFDHGAGPGFDPEPDEPEFDPSLTASGGPQE